MVPDAHFDQLVAFVTTRFRTGRYLPIIIDQSTIRGRWEVVWASIPFRGRALPIAFRLFRYADIADSPQGSQNTLEETFVRQVVRSLPDGVEPLLLFDRGYARVSLFRLLDQLGVRYVVRVEKDVWVRETRNTKGFWATSRCPPVLSSAGPGWPITSLTAIASSWPSPATPGPRSPGTW